MTGALRVGGLVPAAELMLMIEVSAIVTAVVAGAALFVSGRSLRGLLRATSPVPRAAYISAIWWLLSASLWPMVAVTGGSSFAIYTVAPLATLYQSAQYGTITAEQEFRSASWRKPFALLIAAAVFADLAALLYLSGQFPVPR